MVHDVFSDTLLFKSLGLIRFFEINNYVVLTNAEFI